MQSPNEFKYFTTKMTLCYKLLTVYTDYKCKIGEFESKL